jgi:putative salt-induced outer membrane protein
MKFSLFTILLAFSSTSAFANYTNESELGILVAKGNSDSQSYTAKQAIGKIWEDKNSLKFSGRYLQTKTSGLENARYWAAGLRYDYALSSQVGLFLGELVESDKYAGYNQKYSTDIGAKYIILNEKKLVWNAELGYRHTIENQTSGLEKKLNYLRGYTEAIKNWNETVSTKLWFEYLPNFTIGSDYQMNTELSVSAALNNMFALKTGYLLRYDNLPNPGTAAKTDTLLTTSLVAKF